MKSNFNIKNQTTVQLKTVYPKLKQAAEHGQISQDTDIVDFYNSVKSYDTEKIYVSVHYGVIVTLIELIETEIGFRVLNNVEL